MVSPILKVSSAVGIGCGLMVLSVVIIFYTNEPTTIVPDEGLKHIRLECYRAAVLDYSHPHSKKRTNEQTMEVFTKAVQTAKQNKVELIVFPESAFTYSGKDRLDWLDNIEQLPVPKDFPSELCNKDGKPAAQLACLARDNQMYLVAQLLDKQPCEVYNPESDRCPADGFFVFNTAVMFDREGKLIGKYHKMQPYGEMRLNASKDELFVIHTELGRFTMQICFDLIFEKPSHHLAEKEKVDSVLFPTHWMNEAPFLAASQIQMAWAFANKVNLLASNIHEPTNGVVGSGLYSSTWKGTFVFNANFANDTGLSRLIMADLPTQPRNKRCQCKASLVNVLPVQLDGQNNGELVQYAYKQMNSTFIKWKTLDLQNGSISLEDNGVRCDLRYNANFSQIDTTKYKYFLMASNRLRPNPSYSWGEELCAVTYAKINKNGTFYKYRTTDLKAFHWIRLEAKFSEQTVVHPSVVEHQHQPVDTNKWFFSKVTNERYVIEFGLNDNSKELNSLSILSLFGRVYERDPLYRQVPVNGEKLPEPED